MESNAKDPIMLDISQEDAERIYRMQQRTYWEADLINRCEERCMEGTGLCNVPYERLADESVILDMAYELYCKIEDSNIAYNDTLDAVIDEMERCISNSVPKLSLMKAKKKLNVVCTCTSYYTSSIEVPADYTLEQAIAYAKEHIDEISIESDLEYIGDSDELDEEHCEFAERMPEEDHG